MATVTDRREEQPEGQQAICKMAATKGSGTASGKRQADEQSRSEAKTGHPQDGSDRRERQTAYQGPSRRGDLAQHSFLGFQIGVRGKAVWTTKAHARFKQRVKEITRRNRGHRVRVT